MKYSLEQTKSFSFRSISYYIGADIATTCLSAILVLLIIVSCFIENWLMGMAVLGGSVVFAIVFLTVLGIGQRKYRNEKGKIVWHYDLSADVIKVKFSATEVVFDKQGVKWSRAFKYGVFFRHDQSAFIVMYPKDKKQEVFSLLSSNGWLKRRRVAAARVVVWGISSILIAFMTGVILWMTIHPNLPSAVSASPERPKVQLTPDMKAYFFDVALENEYHAIEKWTKPRVAVKLTGAVTDATKSCVNVLIKDLNSAVKETQYVLDDEVPADVTVHFIPRSQFKEVESSYESPYFGWGVRTYSKGSDIQSSTILIDNTDEISDASRCSVFLEMLVVNSGLAGKSDVFTDSIFMSDPGERTQLSARDREIINVLYGGYGIDAGMLRDDIESRIELIH